MSKRFYHEMLFNCWLKNGRKLLVIKATQVQYWRVIESNLFNHELLISNLYVFRFSKDVLKLIHSYMSNRWSGKNFNRFVSFWSTVMKRMPKGLELGSVLLNIYVNNLILFLDFSNCNYADDTSSQNVCRDQLE